MIHAETSLLDASGDPVSLGRLSPDDRVLGAPGRHRMGSSPILEVFSKASLDSVEIVTSCGNRVRCTPDHLVGVPGKNGQKLWRAANTLRAGDKVLCAVCGTLVHDKIEAAFRHQTPRPTYFVAIATKLHNVFCGGVLCRA